MPITKKSREQIRLIWVDLEMSGLNPDHDTVLEAAFVITDADLNITTEAATWVIHQPDAVLENMDKWNTRTHNHSGLVDECRASSLTLAAAEREILRFLKKHVKQDASPMCGNSICQDRRFMARCLPRVERFFHYRNFDVSSFKIAASLFAPKVLEKLKKPSSSHRACDDILASVAEMRNYVNEILPARSPQ